MEQAVSDVLAQGIRTADIIATGGKPVSTNEMGDAILGALEKLSGKQKVA